MLQNSSRPLTIPPPLLSLTHLAFLAFQEREAKKWRPPEKGTASYVVQQMHHERSRVNASKHPGFRTSYEKYGLQGSLEQFGVADKGRKALRTKLPSN